jgi:hypothetical protein
MEDFRERRTARAAASHSGHSARPAVDNQVLTEDQLEALMAQLGDM